MGQQVTCTLRKPKCTTSPI